MSYDRITNNSMSDGVLRNLYQNQNLLIELQRKAASGKEFVKASQDVFSATTVLSSDSALGKIDNYLNNINTARSELETADKSLMTTLDIVHNARDFALQSLNATTGREEYDLMSSQLDQLIHQVKDIGNTKYGSKYIFGGKVTNSPAYTEPTPGEFKYNGSENGSHQRDVEISEGVDITVNMSGDALFGYHYTGDHDNDPVTPDTLEGEGLLHTLITLKEELETDPPDMDVIRDKIDELDASFSTLIGAQSTLGGLLTRLDITENIHKDNSINLSDKKSLAQDIDFAKVVSDMKFQETALQASLQVGARIIQPSLMNFLS